ncbi:MAG: FAD-dependent oxidoreductase, partial [Cutibacterium sp.]|nr:FAD-dependent oxidoreductase [Cutibacterium sp.]
LNHMGYTVTVFEKNEAAGGLLRYGIPNFKLNKAIIDRRIALLEQEGIEFKYNVEASPSPSEGGGVEIHLSNVSGNNSDASGNQTSSPSEGLGEAFDAIVIASGTPTARDLKAPGRELKGVHFALEMLSQQNRVLAGMEFSKDERITAKGKDVLVIGGGDTGSDCIGTAHRQGCKSVTQIEIMPRPVEGPEDPQNPWPEWPRTLKTTSSHEEGCTRRWNINTLEFLSAATVPDGFPVGKDASPDHVAAVRIQPIDWKPDPAGGRPIMVEAGEPEIIKAELVLLAMGFLKPEHPEYPKNVFVCGDSANGASLVVRAMASGRDTAKKVAAYLER